METYLEMNYVFVAKALPPLRIDTSVAVYSWVLELTFVRASVESTDVAEASQPLQNETAVAVYSRVVELTLLSLRTTMRSWLESSVVVAVVLLPLQSDTRLALLTLLGKMYRADAEAL